MHCRSAVTAFSRVNCFGDQPHFQALELLILSEATQSSLMAHSTYGLTEATFTPITSQTAHLSGTIAHRAAATNLPTELNPSGFSL